MNPGVGIRKLALGALAVWTCLVGGSAIAGGQASTNKPNILFIMADDVAIAVIGLDAKIYGRRPVPLILDGFDK